MTVQDFARTLAKELVSRGVSRDEAVKHSAALVRTFSREDMQEVEGYGCGDDFKDLSDSLAALIFARAARAVKSAASPEAFAPESVEKDAGDDAADTYDGVTDKALKETEAPENTAEKKAVFDKESGAIADTANTDSADIGSTRAFDTVRVPEIGTEAVAAPTGVVSAVSSAENRAVLREVADGDTQEIYLEEEVAPIREKAVLTPRGKVFFWIITVLTSPIWVCCGVFVMCVFGICIAAVCAFMAACICLVCAEAAAGGAVALVGIIYGISRIFTGSPATGIFEIGIGVVVGGIALALGILTYNFAVVVLPGLLKQLISFEGYCLRRVPHVLDRFREECNRL